MMFVQYNQKVSNDMERKKEEQSYLKRNNQGNTGAMVLMKAQRGKWQKQQQEFRRWQLKIIPK